MSVERGTRQNAMNKENTVEFKRMAAFGASVTQQKNGYADRLAAKLGKKVKKFGYGGMHLPNAGMCFLDTVAKYRPDCVLVDWLSTGFMERSQKTLRCIDTILYKFSATHCAVVFLILPSRRTDGRQAEKDAFHDFCREALRVRGAHVIDIDSQLKGSDLTAALRDSIHTTARGAEAYSDLILGWLAEKCPKPLPPDRFGQNAYYKDVRWMRVGREFRSKMELTLDGEILGMYCTIGRNSGICAVRYGDGTVREEKLWDRWCHYERKQFCLPIEQYVGPVEIQVLQDSFETSSCASSAPVDFSKYRKTVVCHAICWRGNALELKNRKSGKRLGALLITAMRLLRGATHIAAARKKGKPGAARA